METIFAPSPIEINSVNQQSVEAQQKANQLAEQVEVFKELVVSPLGREALKQAGVQDLLTTAESANSTPPFTFIEEGIARIALGSII